MKPIFDVICPGCGQSFHQTTQLFDAEKVVNPSMLTLKDKYISYGWEQIPADATAGYGCLECPDCGASLCPNGKLKTSKPLISVSSKPKLKKEVFKIKRAGKQGLPVKNKMSRKIMKRVK